MRGGGGGQTDDKNMRGNQNRALYTNKSDSTKITKKLLISKLNNKIMLIG